jgi:hypothetical protein
MITTSMRRSLWEQQVFTVNVSRKGALLKGIQNKQVMGSHVSLGRLNKVERFEITWIGEENARAKGRIGVFSVDPGDLIDVEPQSSFSLGFRDGQL